MVENIMALFMDHGVYTFHIQCELTITGHCLQVSTDDLCQLIKVHRWLSATYNKPVLLSTSEPRPQHSGLETKKIKTRLRHSGLTRPRTRPWPFGL